MEAANGLYMGWLKWTESGRGKKMWQCCVCYAMGYLRADFGRVG